jgi:hypothetical protein
VKARLAAACPVLMAVTGAGPRNTRCMIFLNVFFKVQGREGDVISVETCRLFRHRDCIVY